MSARPKILFDPFPRRTDMFLAPEMRTRLEALGEVVLHEGSRMPAEMVERVLPEAMFVLGQTDLPRERLERAPKLKAIVNVEGNFQPNVDYGYCLDRGIHVLVIAPAFALPVAEMALGLAIDCARGITRADRDFRQGRERYGIAGSTESLQLTGNVFGLIGFGNLGRALLPLLRPFHGRVLAHDPWLPEGLLREHAVEPVGLDRLLAEARIVFMLAAATADNQAMLGAREFGLIQQGSVFVLASRAAVVDFPAFLAAAKSGRIKAATDVFPVEPVPADDPVRGVEEVILSAHRAGGVRRAHHEIGLMTVEDCELIARGLPPVRCQPARRETAHLFRSMPARSYAQKV
ncbi:MAG: hydroxyacid dehydrogenase [Alphaproteobacteria bacterium]|nr:hydroxyacid dehydrogenase [Alphaproteobacteria bacterium]